MNLIDAALIRAFKKLWRFQQIKPVAQPIYMALQSSLPINYLSPQMFMGEKVEHGFPWCVTVTLWDHGSVIPYFLSLPENEPLPVTDTRMTHFMITLEEGIALVNRAFNDMRAVKSL